MKLEVTWFYVCMGEDYHAYTKDGPLCGKNLPPSRTLIEVGPLDENGYKCCKKCLRLDQTESN